MSHFWHQTGGRPDDIKPFIAIGSNGSATHANNTNHAILYSKSNDNYINNNNNNSTSLWDGRSIASSKLKLMEFTAFTDSGITSSNRHVFVRIEEPSFSDPLLEDIDLRQITDKFPSNRGGLKELYDKGPENAFFLVKFWADLNIPSLITDQRDVFYGVTSHFESHENMNLSCSTKVCSFGKQAVEKLEVSSIIHDLQEQTVSTHRL
jgi:transcriptional enhancer factor